MQTSLFYWITWRFIFHFDWNAKLNSLFPYFDVFKVLNVTVDGSFFEIFTRSFTQGLAEKPNDLRKFSFNEESSRSKDVRSASLCEKNQVSEKYKCHVN